MTTTATVALTLSCIGAGRLGSTLCRLFAEQATQPLQINQILNNHLESATRAVQFIGSGEATESIQQLVPADLWLIATPDDAIAEASRALVDAGVLRAGDIVFHCSGVLGSETLANTVSTTDSYRASVHPVHSFADPMSSLSRFAGSSCAVEGDDQACARLGDLFSAIGGNCFALQGGHKALYHAATVMACNNLVALLATSKQMLGAAGIDDQLQAKILAPLIRQTVENTINNPDPATVLTGPVSRGDSHTVAAHLEAMAGRPQWQKIYSTLGEAAVDIARQQGYASDDELEQITALLTAASKPDH